MQWGWIALLAIIVAIVGAMVFLRRSKQQSGASASKATYTLSAPHGPAPASLPPIQDTAPDTLVIGETPDRPLLTVKKKVHLALYEGSRSEAMHDGALARLSSVLQAAPSLLIASQSAGKRLMEVVINGELTPASSGGLRAFAMEGGKIVEHGKLFDPGKLQTMINAAAVWQVASVLVAQKHLADISQKLSDIKACLDRVAEFQEVERRSKIMGTYAYLSQVAQAIQEGQLSTEVRAQLEGCERDLLAIQNHLFEEFRSAMTRRVKDTDTVGTEALTNGIKTKIERLSELAADMELCLRTRIGAWHVLSAYPGERALIEVRRASIQKSCDEMRNLAAFMELELEAEIAAITAFFNRKSTLMERRSMLRGRREDAKIELVNKADAMVGAIHKSMQALLLQHQPTRILLEVSGGQIVNARQAIAQSR